MCQGTKLTFFAPGRPKAKARARIIRGGGRGFYTPKPTREWESCVGWSFLAEHPGHEPFPKDLPLAVVIRLRFHTSHWSKVRGDLDNYMKAILDGLNHVAWEDDRQIVEALVRKETVKNKEEEGVWVAIRPATSWLTENGSEESPKGTNSGS